MMSLTTALLLAIVHGQMSNLKAELFFDKNDAMRIYGWSLKEYLEQVLRLFPLTSSDYFAALRSSQRNRETSIEKLSFLSTFL